VASFAVSVVTLPWFGFHVCLTSTETAQSPLEIRESFLVDSDKLSF